MRIVHREQRTLRTDSNPCKNVVALTATGTELRALKVILGGGPLGKTTSGCIFGGADPLAMRWLGCDGVTTSSLLD